MDYMLWVWLILAAVLLIGEMLTAGFFLIIFGIGAIGAAVATAFGGGQVVQWITFVAVSAIAFGLTRGFAQRVHSSVADSSVGADRYVGRKARVVEAVDNSQGKGMVRVEQEQWRAESHDESVIADGALVEIVSVDGAHLIVKPFHAPTTEQEA
jgi:membrane protein implicated in regulation of membrane protease activity